MKKILLLSFLLGISYITSAAENFISAPEETTDFYVRATPTLSINTSGDFYGPGITLDVGYKTNWLGLNDAIELDFSYTDLTGGGIPWILYIACPFFLLIPSDYHEAGVDRFLVMANYSLSDTFGETKAFWYAGAGAGLAIQHATQTITSINVWQNINQSSSTHHTYFAPALQIFIGIGYNISKNWALYAGGNMVATQSISFSAYDGNGQIWDQLELEPITFGLQIGGKFSF
jgi:opacity protein-like surface antigen